MFSLVLIFYDGLPGQTSEWALIILVLLLYDIRWSAAEKIHQADRQSQSVGRVRRYGHCGGLHRRGLGYGGSAQESGRQCA